MGAADGARAVVGQALAVAGEQLTADRRAAAGEQLAMLPLPIGTPAAKHLRRDAERRNKAGRPPGAVNKSSKALRDYLLARGVHPLQRMMEWSMHTPQSLAAELGCTLLEAFDRLREVWRDTAPYFAPKLVPTDDQGREVPFFAMQIVAGHAHVAAGEGAMPWIDPATGAPWGAASKRARVIEQNQPLGASAANVSHDEKSHEGEQ